MGESFREAYKALTEDVEEFVDEKGRTYRWNEGNHPEFVDEYEGNFFHSYLVKYVGGTPKEVKGSEPAYDYTKTLKKFFPIKDDNAEEAFKDAVAFFEKQSQREKSYHQVNGSVGIYGVYRLGGKRGQYIYPIAYSSYVPVFEGYKPVQSFREAYRELNESVGIWTYMDDVEYDVKNGKYGPHKTKALQTLLRV